MADFNPQNREEIQQAFQESEREVWIRNFRITCILAIIFVLAGNMLEYMVYPNDTGDFKGKHLLDLWTKKEVSIDGSTKLRVPRHGVLLLEQR